MQVSVVVIKWKLALAVPLSDQSVPCVVAVLLLVLSCLVAAVFELSSCFASVLLPVHLRRLS